MVTIDRYYQRGKNVVHALQALFIFLGAAVTVAIYTKGGKGDERINYYFVLCFLSIPTLIYQTAIPIFPRVRRFSLAYAHAAVDALWMILWFAAFIAVAVWVHDGSRAAKNWKSGDSSCDTFAWGPVGKCKLGKASTGMGVVIWLLFILTTAISIYGAYYYRSHGTLPSDPVHAAEPIDAEDADNYAFSANPHDKFIAPQELQDMRSDDDNRNDDEHPPIRPDHDIEGGPHPHSSRPMSWGPEPVIRKPVDRDFETVDTSYHNSTSPPYDNDPNSLPLPSPSPLSHRVPSPLSHRVPSPLSNRVPSPHYDTIHSNESHFIGGLQQPPSPLSARTPSPGYEAYNSASRSNSFANDPRFAPPALQAGRAGAGDPFRDDSELRHESGGNGSGQIDFPEGAYGRVGVFDRG